MVSLSVAHETKDVRRNRPLLAAGVLAALLGAALSGACSRNGKEPSKGTAGATPSTSSASLASASASAEPKVPTKPKHPAEAVLMAWNVALDHRDPDKLAPLYAPRVLFYGAWKSAEDVLKLKKGAFTRAPDYRQRVENVRIAKGPKGYVIRFAKCSSPKLDEKVAARLVLESVGDQLLIVQETDAVTDRRLRRPEPATCGDAAFNAVSAHPMIASDMERVAREYPEARPSGLIYEDEGGKLDAAWGYMLPERFDPRYWLEVENGQLRARNAYTGEELAFAADVHQTVREACSPVDAGSK